MRVPLPRLPTLPPVRMYVLAVCVRVYGSGDGRRPRRSQMGMMWMTLFIHGPVGLARAPPDASCAREHT